ncbi:MAG: Crp/Fnr family transcriptional regulator [Fluviicola sp.]
MSIALQTAISQMISASPEEIAGFLVKCNSKSFGKKELLHDTNTPVNEVFFIEKGLVRVKISDIDGREHTTHFAIENQFIADYTAFLQNEKSSYQLEAMESTDTIILTREAIDWGYDHMKEGNKLGRIIAESYFIYLDTRIQRMYTLSPFERYELLNSIFPGIHNRVPQHMIASYLGITPIHLSRIKRNSL